MQGIAPEYFDENIPKAQKMMLDLAYVNARMANPTGEVSRQALERSIESLGGGSMLSNNASVLAAIRTMRQGLNAQGVSIDRLRNPQATAPQQTDPQAGATGAPENVDPNVWQYMTPEERALWQN
jgi:hypothetical protein